MELLIRDHWYVGCPSSRLTESEPRGIQVGPHHLVLFRDANGAPRALADRCCHRNVRLSLGRMRDGCVACGYHGWEFDGSGRLVHVPSLSAGSALPDASVPSYPALERDHYIWVWIAGQSATPTYEPRIQGLTDGVWIQQTAIWQTPVLPALENQLDVAHTAFSHPGIYPGHESAPGEMPRLQETEFECRADDASVVIFAPPRAPDDAPPGLGPGIGLFELPFRNYVFLGADDTRAIYNWVPLSERHCRLEFLGFSQSAQGAAPPTSGRQVFYLEQELPLLAQDRALLESAQRAIETGGEQPERSVVADAAPLMARRLVERALRGEQAGSARAAQKRRTFRCLC